MTTSAGHSVQRPTFMEIDLSAIAANYAAVQAHVGGAAVMPIVKADAYGHGLVECARRLEAADARWFGVAFVEEGVRLREAGVTARILVMGGVLGEQLRLYLEHDLDITASSIDKLRAIDETARETDRTARVHLKIDTGMERVGVHHYNAAGLFEAALRSRHCEIVGVYSHLAMSRREDLPTTRLQLERFLEAVSFFEKRSEPVPLRHLANTAGLLADADTHLDMVRPGLAIYGVLPCADYVGEIALRPAMSLRSRVVYFKVVPEGSGVSYEWKWKTPRQTRVATVPIGYGDGYFRRLSNKGEVLIRGVRKPIVGAVCMDQFMVDLGPDGEAWNGDEVVLVGEQNGQRITVEDISRIIETTPHETLVSLNHRIPRVCSDER